MVSRARDRSARRSCGGWSTSRRRRDGRSSWSSRRSSRPTPIRHPNKVVWLVHQFRQAYELDGTELGQFGEDPFGRATVARDPAARSHDARRGPAAVRDLRRTSPIGSSARRGSRPRCSYPPPQQLDYRSSDGVGSFILSVGRLDRAKRIDLLLEAAALDKSLRVVVAGDGPDRQRLEQLSSEHGLDGRVTFAGRVADDELVDLYADCLAVFYAPIDEDLGLVPYEAFLSEKPVVTTRDAGGPLEVVVDRENGLVCEPAPGRRRRSICLARGQPRAGACLGSLGQADCRADHVGQRRRPPPRLLKVAYFSPLPPERSGIADYSALLLPALATADGCHASYRGERRRRRAAPTSRSTTSATIPTRTAGSWMRSSGDGGSSSSTTSSCTTSLRG